MATKSNAHDMALSLSFEALDFKKQMSSIEKEIRDIEKNFKIASKSVESFESTFQGLDSKIQKTSKQLDLYNTKLEKQKEEYDDLKDTVDKQIQKLNELEKTQGRGSKEWQQQSDLVHKNSQKLTKLGTDMNQTKSNISKLSKELEGSKKDFEALEKVTKTLDEELLTIARDAKKSESEFNKLSEELKDSGKYFENLSNEINKISTRITSASQKSGLYEKEIEKLNMTLDKNKKEYSDVSNKIVTYQAQLERCKSVYGENSEQAEKYRQKLLRLKDEHRSLENEIEKNNNTLDDYQVELNQTQAELKALERELSSMPFEKFSADLKSAGQRLTSIGSSLTRNVSVPLAAITAIASKFAMEFESGMAKVGTIADTTKVPISQLKKELIELSNSTGQGTSDLTEAMYQAISASVDTADAVSFLDTAVKAAVGGFTDTTTAVDGLTSVLNAYGLEADEATRIGNEMLVTQNKGKTTFGELAKSIGNVAPLTAALNMETKELFSSLAVTTAQGLETSVSISGLKAALSNIIKPSKDAADAAELLGVEFSASALESKGWQQFLVDIKKAMVEVEPTIGTISDTMSRNADEMLKLADAGKQNSAEYKKLHKRQVELRGSLEQLATSQESPISGFAKMFGSVEGLNAVLMLTSETGMALYNETIQEMGTNTTALDKAYGQMSETTEFKFKKAMNESKNAIMELGVKLLPTINKAIDLFSDLVDKFNEMSPAQQDNLIKFGMMAMVLGPILSGVGNLTSGLGSAVSMFGKFSAKGAVAAGVTKTVGASAGVAASAGGIGGLLSGMGSLALAAAPWIAAAGGVALAGYGIYKVLDQDLIPAVDLFEDQLISTGTVMTQYGEVVTTEVVKISEATQEAVGAYMNMHDGVNEALMGLYYSSEVITTETCNSMMTKYNEMGQTITAGLEEDKVKDIEVMSNFFATANVLTEEQEGEMLRLTQEAYQGKKLTIEETQAQINGILTNALNEQRALKESEVVEIQGLQEQMRTQAVNTLSEQAKEAQVILDRMASYDARITAEQAGTHISTLNEQRDKAIDSANTEYREVVSTVERMRDELGVISSDQAQTMIDEATRQKDETINAAKETRDGAVDKIFGMNEDLIDNVDSSTGEIVSTWDKLFGKWDKWSPGKKTVNVETKYSTSGTPTEHSKNAKSRIVQTVENMSQALGRGVDKIRSASTSSNSNNPSIVDSDLSIPMSKYKLSANNYTPGTDRSRDIILKGAESTDNTGFSELAKSINNIKSDEKPQVFIVKNYVGEDEVSESIFKKVNNEFALQSKRRR